LQAELVEAHRKLGTKRDLIGAETLRDGYLELRKMYLGLANRQLSPRLSKLRNTDNDSSEMFGQSDLEFPSRDLDRPAIEAVTPGHCGHHGI